MRCTNCGVELEPEARFCQDCGTPVPGTGAKSVKPINASKASGGAKRSRTTAVIVGVLSVIALAVVIAAAVILLGGRSSGPASASDASSGAASDVSSSSASSQAASSSASSEKSKKSKKSKKKKEFVQADAEAQARKDAQKAGMQILSGTVRLTTYGQRAAEISKDMSKTIADYANYDLALLVFSLTESVSAMPVNAQGTIETRTDQECLALSNPDLWRELDGQLVTVAAYPEDLLIPDDVGASLYAAVGGAEIIAPLTEDSAAALTHSHSELPSLLPLPAQVVSSKSKSAASASSDAAASSSAAAASTDGGYMLADSNTRAYSKAELSKLSDYELFVARNEIYARHGRTFQSQELKDYFGSKSWYKPGNFDEKSLSQTEIANASLILEIEQSRNSKYL